MDTPMGNTGFGNTSGSDLGRTSSTGTNIGTNAGTGTNICPTCGQPTNRGLEQFLGKLGISDEMINNLKSSFQNVDLDEYLNTARGYLKDSGSKATTFAKENPGKVAAGVAVLAVGAGLLISALNKD